MKLTHILFKPLAGLFSLALIFGIFGGTVLNAPTVEAAQVDYFLKLEGISGESTSEGHVGEIDIQSWSWGATNPGISRGSSAGGGGGAGKVSMQDFHFTKTADKSSPQLMQSAATGKHIKSATLSVRKSGSIQNFYIIKLSDVLISSYQAGGSSGALPTDSFSLNFAKIEFQYLSQASGISGACWQQPQNRACPAPNLPTTTLPQATTTEPAQ